MTPIKYQAGFVPEKMILKYIRKNEQAKITG
jgi:hypothetical protein